MQRAKLVSHPDLHNVYLLDQGAMPYISRMMRNGMCLDMEYLRGLSSDLGGRISKLEKEILEHVPRSSMAFINGFIDGDGEDDGDNKVQSSEFNVNSSEQMGEFLFNVLQLGKGKELKRTKSGRVSTGKKQLEDLREDHPIIDLVLDYREAKKLKTTYADAMPKLAKLHSKGPGCVLCGRKHYEDCWRLHTEILSTRTATGRYASRKPNLQNLPTRTPLGQLIRAALCAETGYVLVGCDYSQIELRLLAHAAIERVMIRVYAEGGDIHLKTAMSAFGIVDPKEVDGILHRLPAKTVNFGVVYGMTEIALYVQLVFMLNQAIKRGKTQEIRDKARKMKQDLTLDWCKWFINESFFGTYPGVQPYMKEQYYRANRYGYVWDIGGRIRRTPELKSALPWIRGAGERQAGNSPIQGGATVFMKLACYDLDEVIELMPGLEPVMTIHDELQHEAPEDKAEEYGECVQLGMEAVGVLRVPLVADCKVSKMDESGRSRWRKE